ncbi:TPA: BppU family phage baseplate upper protein [Enterococcus faecium]|uniref:BppU family phage baseplate upper protein n=2 Tax=Enterococcus faecium TaxID=1352 RepID=UPI001F5BD4A3|nr:BppU family phage baseplate upper protein [Enterococcus faecium]
MVYKMNESIIVIQAEATSPNRTNVVFWSHDRGTAKLRMKLVRKNGIPQSLPEGTTVPIRLMFKSATAEGGYGKHDYLATVEDPVNGIVSIVLEDNILGYVGTVEGSVYIDFPNDRSLDTAGRFTFYIKRSPIDDSTPELEDYYFNGFSQTIDKIEKILADGKLEIEQKITESETQIDAKVKDTNDKITKANQDVATLDQNLTELRNDMKLSEAWAWSKDGTDRFTRKYPGENYILNSKTGKEKLANAGWDDAYAYLSETINGNSGEFEVGFDLVILDEIAENTKIDITLQTKGGGLPIQTIFPYRIITINPNQTIHITNKFTADYSTVTAAGARIAAKFGGIPTVKVRLDNFYLKCASEFPENWTPAPSEDYENAYPQYRGVALLPSDLPDDYSWDVTPEYTEKGLNNTVSLTEPQSVEGLKNFEDGLQIAGKEVATVPEDTGWVNLTAINGHSWNKQGQIRRIGKLVMFRGSLKGSTLSTQDFCTIPEGFRPSNPTDNYEYQFLLPPQSSNTLDNGGMAYIRPNGVCGLPSFRGTVNLFLAPIQYYID